MAVWSLLFFFVSGGFVMLKKLLKWIYNPCKDLEDKLYHLEVLIRQDNQWMAHNTIARALTDRYLKALSDNWGSVSFEQPDKLRDLLHCNPRDKESISIDAIKDLNINLASILYEGLNDRQKRTFISGIRTAYDLSNIQIATMLNINRVDILNLFIKDTEE